MNPTDKARALAAQSRMVALVIIGALLAWFALQWLGARAGWSSRVMFLFDLAALAAFVWAFIVTLQIWRKRRDIQG